MFLLLPPELLLVILLLLVHLFVFVLKFKHDSLELRVQMLTL